MSDLRKRKYARTRLALAHALSVALRKHPLSDISVKALCRTAEVSEATFFNYFPNKLDLMAYLAQLWLLEFGWHARAAAGAAHGWPAIKRQFIHTARMCTEEPGVMKELIAWLALGGRFQDSGELREFEKQIAFPTLDGIETVPVQGVDAWMLPQLEEAMKKGELPDNTLVPTLLSLLLAILFGVPLTLLASNPVKISDMYQQQLQLALFGCRAASGA